MPLSSSCESLALMLFSSFLIVPSSFARRSSRTTGAMLSDSCRCLSSSRRTKPFATIVGSLVKSRPTSICLPSRAATVSGPPASSGLKSLKVMPQAFFRPVRQNGRGGCLRVRRGLRVLGDEREERGQVLGADGDRAGLEGRLGDPAVAEVELALARVAAVLEDLRVELAEDGLLVEVRRSDLHGRLRGRRSASAAGPAAGARDECNEEEEDRDACGAMHGRGSFRAAALSLSALDRPVSARL